MKYLKRFLSEHKGKVAVNVLLALAQSVGILLLPMLMASIVDQGILAGNMDAIKRIGIGMLLVTAFSTVVAILFSWSAADTGATFGRDMRQKLFQRSQELSLRQFNDLGLSSMVTRSTADVTTMQVTVSMVIQMILPAPLLMAAAVVMTFRASSKIALLLLVCLVLLLAFCIWMVRASSPMTFLIQRRLDRVNQMVREHVTGTRVVRAFGREAHEEKRSGTAFDLYADTMIRLGRMFAVVNPAVWLILGLCMAGVLWIGGMMTGRGSMEVGQIMAVAEYTTMALGFLITAAGAVLYLPRLRSCMERLQEVLDTVPDVADPQASAGEPVTDAPVVSFENVSFFYPGAEEPVLQNLDFCCNPGETTAIIGGTGSGKSTVGDLLLRLHDVTDGAIRLHGQDIRHMTQKELRSKIGCVPQKAFLFSGTIAENLRMGKEDATDEELWDALRTAQAEDFVRSLPKGLDAPVAQGGGNFSGGQRQRLAIARALVRKADLYVFDDSFSALDVKTDAALRRALESHGGNAAKLIIAQRVSTILNADQILVLDQSRVVGKGRHEELLFSCPTYQDIVRSQLEQKGA
ncbi:ABC transporter ATP-binding protein [Oscillospiraceae bacterium]|nr:ABC transporter ATP-binding protein [Oscillospiraceae bacterium]